MDKDLIALFKVLKDQGIFKSEDQMMQVIETEGIEVLYPAMPKGMFESVESFVAAFPGAQKKKDESMVIGEEEDMDSITPVEEEEVISSESSGDGEREEGAVVGYEAGRRYRGQTADRERIAREDEEYLREALYRGDESIIEIPTKEKDTLLERALGKNEVTDFFGDIWRAGAKGFETGNTVDEALELSLKGSSASAQDVADFVRVNKRLQETGPSDEMTAFNDAYEKAGGGAWGFISGLIAAPTSVVEIAVTSVAQMVNPATLAGAGVGAATGAAVGSTGFSAGPLGVFTTAGGAIAGALGGAGATLEAGLSFAEFLQEELSEKGLAFNERNVAQILNDDDALFRIRSKSAGRGAVIGIVDGLTAGVAGKVAGGVGKTAVAAGKAAKRANLASKGAATLIEGVGGGIGEAGARLAVGQDLDAAEIGFEAVGGAPGSVISAMRTAAGKGTYTMGPDDAPVTFDQMVKIIQESDDATFAGMKIRIKGDEVLKGMAEDRKNLLKAKKSKAEAISENLEGLSLEDKKAAVDLEVELDKNTGGLSRAKRNRKKEIEAQLDEIYSRKGEVVDVGVEIASIDTRLNEINNQETFTEADIAEKNALEARKVDLQNQQTDAIQESSTTAVDVQEQAADGGEVGAGDTARGVTVESESETTTTDQTTQEEIEPATEQEIEQGANDLDALLGGLNQAVEDNPVNLGDGASGRNRAQDQDQDQTDGADVVTTEEIDQTTVEIDPNIQPDNNNIVVENTDNQTVEIVQSVDKEGNRVTAPPRKGKRIKQGLTVVDNVDGEVDSYYESNNYKTENPDQTPPAHEQRITRIADKALKAIQKVFPDVNIVLHRSDQSYKDHVSQESRGAYKASTNTIHINMPKADALTIAHEVFHAVLKNKLGFEGKIQDVSKRMLKRLKKVIKKSKNLTKEEVLALEDYASNFEGNIQNEEFLAEFVGFLSSTYKKLDTPAKSTVKEWIQSILDFIGLDINIGDINNDDRAVVDLLNVIAEKVATGEEITAQDLQALDEGGSINVGEPGPIQKAEQQAKRDAQFTEEQVIEPAPEQRTETPQEEFDRKKAEQQAKDKAAAERRRKIAEDTRKEFSRKTPGVRFRGSYANFGETVDTLILNPGDNFTVEATVTSDSDVQKFGAKNQPREFNVSIGADGRFVLGRMDPNMDPRMAEEIKRFIDESNKEFRGKSDVSQIALLGLGRNLKNRYKPRGFAMDVTEVVGAGPTQETVTEDAKKPRRGEKQINRNFKALEEATTPEGKFDAIASILNSVFNKGELSAEQQNVLDKTVSELKDQGFELRFKPGDEIKPGDFVDIGDVIGVEKEGSKRVVTRIDKPSILKDGAAIQKGQVEIRVEEAAAQAPAETTQAERDAELLLLS